MARQGHLLSGLATMALALPLSGWFFGFSVDDAWIVARVVKSGLTGGRYQYYPSGPITDAVTPLGFDRLIGGVCQLLGLSDPLLVVRCMGAVAHLLTAFLLGVRAASDGSSRWRVLLLGALLGSSVPLSSWATAGLETPIVGLAVTSIVLLRSLVMKALCTGFVLVWRPECLPLALSLYFLEWRQLAQDPSHEGDQKKSSFTWVHLLTVVPFMAALGYRWIRFDQLMPLSAVAKEPDIASGAFYVLGGLVWTGVIFLVPAWLALRSAPGWQSRWWFPFLLHAFAVAFAGGDWMPYFRLIVPGLPLVLYETVRRWPSSWWMRGLCLGYFAVQILVAKTSSLDARRVVERRSEWMTVARSSLASCRKTAAVDIGYLGYALEGRVLDLAGVTDPRVARLPGGHTSKRVPMAFLDRDGVDCWVVRVAREPSSSQLGLSERWAVYAVDQRLLVGAEDAGFRVDRSMEVAGTSSEYLFLRR